MIRRRGYYLFRGMFGAVIIRGQHLFEAGWRLFHSEFPNGAATI